MSYAVLSHCSVRRATAGRFQMSSVSQLGALLLTLLLWKTVIFPIAAATHTPMSIHLHRAKFIWDGQCSSSTVVGSKVKIKTTMHGNVFKSPDIVDICTCVGQYICKDN